MNRSLEFEKWLVKIDTEHSRHSAAIEQIVREFIAEFRRSYQAEIEARKAQP